MDKTISISGRPVIFRKTGGTMLRYKRQFGRELLSDLGKIMKLKEKADKAKTENDKVELATSVEVEWMYDIAFIMAQQADQNVRDELEWLDSFESFPIWDVFTDLMPMLAAEMKAAPKNA